MTENTDAFIFNADGEEVAPLNAEDGFKDNADEPALIEQLTKWKRKCLKDDKLVFTGGFETFEGARESYQRKLASRRRTPGL